MPEGRVELMFIRNAFRRKGKHKMTTERQIELPRGRIDSDAQAVLKSLKGARWDDDALKLIEDAALAGCRVRRTRGNHVQLTNDLGQSVVVSGGGHGTYRKNAALVKNLLQNQPGGQPDPEPPPVEDPTPVPSSEDLKAAATEQLTQWLCKLCKPPRQLLNQQAFDDHLNATHVRCDYEDPVTHQVCGQWLKSTRSTGPHRSIAHGTKKPWLYKEGAALGPAQGTVERPPKEKAEPAKKEPERPETAPLTEGPKVAAKENALGASVRQIADRQQSEARALPTVPKPPTEQGRMYCINPRHQGRGCWTNGVSKARVQRDAGTRNLAGHDWSATKGTPTPVKAESPPVTGVKVPTYPKGRVVDVVSEIPDRPVLNAGLAEVQAAAAVDWNAAAGSVQDSATTTLRKIRDALGEDPRVAALEKENSDLRLHMGELETRLELMRAGIRQAQEAANL